MAFCNNCGTELKEGMKFCINCGTPVAQAPAPAAPVEPVVEPVAEQVVAPMVEEPPVAPPAEPAEEPAAPPAVEEEPVVEEPAELVVEEPAELVVEEPLVPAQKEETPIEPVAEEQQAPLNEEPPAWADEPAPIAAQEPAQEPVAVIDTPAEQAAPAIVMGAAPPAAGGPGGPPPTGGPGGPPPMGGPGGPPPMGGPGGPPPTGGPGGPPPMGGPGVPPPMGGPGVPPPMGGPGGPPPMGGPGGPPPMGGPGGPPPMGGPGGPPPMGGPGGPPPMGGPGGPPPMGGPGGPPPMGGPGQAVATKKKNTGKIVIFAIIGVILLAAIVGGIFLFAGKDKGADKLIGKWLVAEVTTKGIDMDFSEDFDDLYLELAKKGKGTMGFEDDELTLTWKLKDDKLTLNVTDEDDKMTLEAVYKKDQLIFEDWMDTGLKIVFEQGSGKKKPKPTTTEEPTEETTTEPTTTETTTEETTTEETTQDLEWLELWNNDWFGYFLVEDTYGEWSVFADAFYDALMIMEVDEDGQGRLSIFIDYEEVPWIDATIKADADHFELVEGIFWDYDLDSYNWWVAPSPFDEGDLIYISDRYYDPELDGDDGFDYVFAFRPYGQEWPSDSELLPPGYDLYAEGEGFDGGGGGGDAEAVFTTDELVEIYDTLPLSGDLTYEDIRDQYFYGIDGILEDSDVDFARYKWKSIDNDDDYVVVFFSPDADSGEFYVDGISKRLP